MYTFKRLNTQFAAVAAVAMLVVSARIPAQAPAGSTFKCTDGTYSSAKTKTGACSGHGGVAEAVSKKAAASKATKSAAKAPTKEPATKAATPTPPPAATTVAKAPPKAPAKAPAATASAAGAPANATAQCKDGTYSSSKTRSGTCSKHGGVDKWLKQLP